MIRAGMTAAVLLAGFGVAQPAAASSEIAKPGDGNVYVRFKPIIVSLIQDDRPTGLASVSITLRTPNPKGRDAAEALRPRYIDAFTTTMMVLGQSHIDPRRPMDIDLITRELQRAADRAGGTVKARVLVVDANTLQR